MEDLAQLGIEVDTRQLKQARDEFGRFVKSGDAAGDAAEKMSKRSVTAFEDVSRASNLMAAAFKTIAVAAAALKIADIARDAVMLAARFETMGAVMNVAGNNAGYTKREMAELEVQMRKTGISMIGSREALTSLATANINLADATKLARVAQDVAVVGNVNSTEALQRLIHGIKAGEQEVLRTLGLNVSFEKSYKTLASQLGVTKESLSEAQKMQARTNETMLEAIKYAGIYEESMTTAGKAITSLTRYWEDLKVRAGEVALPALNFGVVRLTEALKAANVELEKAGSAGIISQIGEGLSKAFRVVYETVTILAANIAYVFVMIGREIGGIAAQVAAVLRGDFSGALAIGDAMQKDAEAAKVALNAYEQAIFGTTQATEKLTARQIDNQIATEAARITASLAGKAEAEAAEKKMAADEKKRKAAEAAAKTAKTAHDNAVKQAREYIQGLKDEAAQLDMTDRQQRMYAASRAAIKAPTEALRLQIMQEALALDIATGKWEAKKAAEEIETAAQKQLAETTNGLWEQVRAMEEQVRLHGLTEVAVIDLAMTKVAAQLQSLELSESETIALESQLRALKRLRDATASKMQKDTAKQSAEDAADAWKKAATSIEQSLTDALLRGFESGKGFVKNLVDTIKNYFARLVLQPIIAPITSLGASILTGTDAYGNSGGNSSAGGISGGQLYNSASTVRGAYNYFTGGTTAAATIGQGVASMGTGVGAAFGESAGAYVTNFGVGMQGAGAGSTAAGVGAGATAGAAVNLAAGAIAGIVAGKLISAGYSAIGKSGNTAVVVGTAIGAIWGPIGAAIGGAIGGVVNRAFGRKLKGVGVTGDLVAGGFENGQAYKYMKGGWLRGDKTTYSALDPAAGNSLNFGARTVTDNVAQLAAQLGISTEGMAGVREKIKVNLKGKNEQQIAEEMEKVFAKFSDTLVGSIVNVKEYARQNETATQTLQRMAQTNDAVTQALKLIGRTSEDAFGKASLAAYNAKERLIELAGGFDNLVQQTQFFATNFMSDAERMKPLMDDVAKTMRGLGYASVDTKDEFKRLVLGLNLADESQAKLYVALMQLAPAFAEVEKYTEQLTSAMKEQVGTARNALLDAYKREADALRNTAATFRDFAKSITAFNQSLLLSDASTLSPEKKYFAAKEQFGDISERAYYGDRDAMAQLESAGQAMLDASRDYLASTPQYAQDFDMVRDAMKQVADNAQSQATQTDRQLVLLQAQVSGLVMVNESVLTVAQGIATLRALLAKEAAMKEPVTAVESTAATARAQIIAESLIRSAQEQSKTIAGGGASQGFAGAATGSVIKGLLPPATSNSYGDQLLRKVRGYANGGVASGWAMVGEDGPELVNFSQPSRVYNSNDTRAALRADNGEAAELREQTKQLGALVRMQSEANKQLIARLDDVSSELAQIRRKAVLAAAE